jgi:endonuclease YncB( thermonuclease family)
VVDTLGYPGYQIAWGTKTSMIRKGDFQQGRATFEPDDWIYYAAGTLDYLGTFPSPLMDAEMLVGPHLTAADLAAPFLEGSLGGGGAVEVTVRSYGDGDTTVFNLPSSLSAYQGDSLRYENIDTPETQHPNIDAQPWGYAAADFTNGQLRAATHIMIQSVKGVAVTETYGRLLGFVWITTVANPAPSDYIQLNHEIVVNGFSKVAFSGITTSTMMYQGLSYFSFLVDANNHAAKLGLKVHGETDPNFNYSV